MTEAITDKEIMEWLIRNVKGNMIPAEDFQKFLTSIGLDYDATIQSFSNNGVVYQGGDGFLHLRALPITKPRISLSIGQTIQTEPYNFVKRVASIERDIALTENPVEAMKGLQSLLQVFMESTPVKSVKSLSPDQKQITTKEPTKQEPMKQDSQKPTSPIPTTEQMELQKGLESLEWKPSPTKSYRFWIHGSEIPQNILDRLTSTARLDPGGYVRLGLFSYRIEQDFVGRYGKA